MNENRSEEYNKQYPYSKCIGCGVNTFWIREYYMVHDAVWELANPARDGMLCVGCIEDRIGRRLMPSDFTDAPCNEWAVSKRLGDRMGFNV